MSILCVFRISGARKEAIKEEQRKLQDMKFIISILNLVLLEVRNEVR